MPHEKLTVVSPIAEIDDMPERLRPEGDGWSLKSEARAWNYEKDEGKVTWTWERVVTTPDDV